MNPKGSIIRMRARKGLSPPQFSTETAAPGLNLHSVGRQQIGHYFDSVRVAENDDRRPGS